MPHPDAAALESVRSSLEDLLDRVTGIADRHRADPEDLVTVDLDELERSLRAAARRLDQALRALR